MQLSLLGDLGQMTRDLSVQVLHLGPWRVWPGEDNNVGACLFHVSLGYCDAPGCRQVVAALDGDRLSSRLSRGNSQRRDEH